MLHPFKKLYDLTQEVAIVPQRFHLLRSGINQDFPGGLDPSPTFDRRETHPIFRHRYSTLTFYCLRVLFTSFILFSEFK
jgi:hypothetical protein